MRSAVIPGGAALVAAAGAAFLAKRLVSRDGGIDFEQMIERMPENAPPRWVFHNVTAIRENTERILALLEAKPTSPGASEPPVEPSAPPPTSPA
jgi:hypothetical protein